MQLTSYYLAYKFVMTTLMILQANLFCETLDIPLNQPMTTENVKSSIVSFSDLRGNFETERYRFIFEKGHLVTFEDLNYLNASDPAVLRGQVKTLSGKNSALNTNDVYRLSTNWLTKLGVDIAALENECSCTISQSKIKRPSAKGQLSPTEEIHLPVFDIEWNPREAEPLNSLFKCELKIDGNAKKLLRLYAGDGSIFGSPPMRIRDNQLSEEDKAELEKRLEQAKKENEKVLAQKEEIIEDAKEHFIKSGRGETPPEKIEEIVKMLIETEYNQNVMRIITDMTTKNLLSISDEEFLKMDATQKSNLIKRFVPLVSFPPLKKSEKVDDHSRNQLRSF